jgi:hypothetical protein
MTKSTKERAKKKEEPAKRRYVRPRLIEYGSVAKLTAGGFTRAPEASGHLAEPAAKHR